MISVRFAPSPTGKMHLGNARIALFNYWLAKANDGKFFLRIDDTNKHPLEKEYLNNIKTLISRLDIDNISETIYQSKRSNIYHQYALRLHSARYVYSCQCPMENPTCDCYSRKYSYSEEHCLKFKVPSEQLSWRDQNYKTITTNNIKDWVVKRSQGSFTYNFCSVIDDIELKITHIVRGADHIDNTGKQLGVLQSLGKTAPEFIHLPLIYDHTGSKMSKRHDAGTDLLSCLREGYLSSAISNYLIKMSLKTGDLELLSNNQINSFFQLDSIRFNRAPIRYDPNKLLWYSKKHLQLSLSTPMLKKYAVLVNRDLTHLTSHPEQEYILSVLRRRATNLQACLNYIEFLKNKPTIFSDALRNIPLAKVEAIRKLIALQNVSKKNLMELKELGKAIREIIINDENVVNGFSLREICHVLDQEIIVRRLKNFLTWYDKTRN